MDPFEVLGVTKTASPEVVRAAYKALAKQLHPDRIGTGSNEKMAEVNAAYEILCDEEKRTNYLTAEMQRQTTSPDVFRTIYKTREWQLATTAFPAITSLYLRLERVHPVLAESFARTLLANKSFESAEYQATYMTDLFLTENFGQDWRIRALGNYLLNHQLHDDANRLKEMLSVLGDSLTNRNIILDRFEPHTSEARAALSRYQQESWTKKSSWAAPLIVISVFVVLLAVVALAARIR
jgi:curved DNA-binding protein CbpA